MSGSFPAVERPAGITLAMPGQVPKACVSVFGKEDVTSLDLRS